MIRGLFFDLDGTLVETHHANFEAYKRALADVGFELTPEAFASTIGQQARVFLPRIAPGITEQQLAEVAEHKARYYKDLVHLTRRNDALHAFLQYMKSGHTTVLLTTARRENAKAVLLHHELAEMFDVIITAEDVKVSKPSPECYQLALERTNLKAHEVIAFEDSHSGQLAAEAANIPVIMIKDFANEFA